jgi:hypothetical protein
MIRDIWDFLVLLLFIFYILTFIGSIIAIVSFSYLIIESNPPFGMSMVEFILLYAGTWVLFLGILYVDHVGSSGSQTTADEGTEGPNPTGNRAEDDTNDKSAGETASTTEASETDEPSPDETTSTLSKDPPERIPSVVASQFEYSGIKKHESIGRGGNADIFHGVVTRDSGEVELAVKEPRIDGTLHAEVVERMMDEAETWSKLDDHDHIVTVLDYDSEPLPWIAMEYMDAGHLGARTEEMGLRQKLWTAVAVTEAVDHAHRHAVAHRDLKPENILFRAVEDTWDVPKVADWGLSKHLLEHSESREGLTVEYAAPEQFDSDAGTDRRTDIYQLGAVFYELFTGQPPFEGEMFEVMKQIESEEPTPPSALADVPAELDDILLQAMAKESTERYERVVYLRDDLQEVSDAV